MAEMRGFKLCVRRVSESKQFEAFAIASVMDLRAFGTSVTNLVQRRHLNRHVNEAE
jgi:hypothetical protein